MRFLVVGASFDRIFTVELLAETVPIEIPATLVVPFRGWGRSKHQSEPFYVVLVSFRMRIVNFNQDPIGEIYFLNAGRRPNQYFQDTVLVFHAVVDELPGALEAIVVTADLQGRELFPSHQRSPADGLRLLGEVMPGHLTHHFDELGINSGQHIGALLAGDFYTYPDLHGRGGTGDVSSVWRAFADEYRWVVGVAGNHDTFGDNHKPFSQSNAHFLDGKRIEIEGIHVAGISGVIGNPAKNYRRTHDDFVNQLDDLLLQPTDIALMHDGPDVPIPGCRGIEDVRTVVEMRKPSLVVRGHCHWPTPFVELSSGVQYLNVDATVVIMTA